MYDPLSCVCVFFVLVVCLEQPHQSAWTKQKSEWVTKFNCECLRWDLQKEYLQNTNRNNNVIFIIEKSY